MVVYGARMMRRWTCCDGPVESKNGCQVDAFCWSHQNARLPGLALSPHLQRHLPCDIHVVSLNAPARTPLPSPQWLGWRLAPHPPIHQDGSWDLPTRTKVVSLVLFHLVIITLHSYSSRNCWNSSPSRQTLEKCNQAHSDTTSIIRQHAPSRVIRRFLQHPTLAHALAFLERRAIANVEPTRPRARARPPVRVSPRLTVCAPSHEYAVIHGRLRV